jgi:HSP20 family protein
MVFRYQSPRQTMDQLRDEVNRLFNGLLPNGAGGWLPTRGQPAVNVWETDDAVVAELEAPGVKSEQVDVSVAQNELTLSVQRPAVEMPETTFHRRERPTGDFTRVIRLPAAVDPDRVSAALHEGVLTITLPKAEGSKPRKINVKAG